MATPSLAGLINTPLTAGSWICTQPCPLKWNAMMRVGSWWTFSLTYLQEILGKKQSKLYLSNLFRDAIIKCSEVEKVEVRDLEFDEGSRTYKVWFEAMLSSGEKLQFKGVEGIYV